MDLAGGARVSEREVEAQLQAATERASERRSSRRSQREAEAPDRQRSLEAHLLPPDDELGDLSEGAVPEVCEHVADAEPELENATLAVVAALTSTIASFLHGFTLGFTSPAQVDLEAHGDTPCAQSSLGLCLNTAQFSFYSGIVNVAALVGDLIIPSVTDYFGRRSALQASAIPLATGWFVQSISNEYSQLLIGRILTGFGIGASYALFHQFCNLNQFATDSVLSQSPFPIHADHRSCPCTLARLLHCASEAALVLCTKG